MNEENSIKSKTSDVKMKKIEKIISMKKITLDAKKLQNKCNRFLSRLMDIQDAENILDTL